MRESISLKVEMVGNVIEIADAIREGCETAYCSKSVLGIKCK